MTTILIIHHSPTQTLKLLLETICESIILLKNSENDEIHIRTVAALEPDITEFLAADGYIFLSPANIGYISGAMKHYLDLVYNPTLEVAQKKFYTGIIHGNFDLSGAVRALTKICHGMGLQLGYPLVETIGEISAPVIAQVEEAAASLVARICVQW